MGTKNMEACKLSSTQMRPTHAAIAEIGQSVKLNNKIVFGGLFLVIAVSCATFGLTLGAVELAKEAKVSDTGVLTSMTGQPVKVQCQKGSDKAAQQGQVTAPDPENCSACNTSYCWTNYNHITNFWGPPNLGSCRNVKCHCDLGTGPGECCDRPYQGDEVTCTAWGSNRCQQDRTADAFQYCCESPPTTMGPCAACAAAGTIVQDMAELVGTAVEDLPDIGGP